MSVIPQHLYLDHLDTTIHTSETFQVSHLQLATWPQVSLEDFSTCPFYHVFNVVHNIHLTDSRLYSFPIIFLQVVLISYFLQNQAVLSSRLVTHCYTVHMFMLMNRQTGLLSALSSPLFISFIPWLTICWVALCYITYILLFVVIVHFPTNPCGLIITQ